jgi:hypothetical protein
MLVGYVNIHITSCVTTLLNPIVRTINIHILTPSLDEALIVHLLKSDLNYLLQ